MGMGFWIQRMCGYTVLPDSIRCLQNGSPHRQLFEDNQETLTTIQKQPWNCCRLLN